MRFGKKISPDTSGGAVPASSAEAELAEHEPVAAGGFKVIGNDGYRDAGAPARAFADSGASVVVICSSDKLYPEIVPQLAPRLKAAALRARRHRQAGAGGAIRH